MGPYNSPSPSPGAGPTFPSLPIVSPDPPRLSQGEKYGGLFYLGITGLVVILALIGWFAYGVWSHRSLWSNIYVLHDTHRPEPERNRAALALSRDRRVNQRQLWDMGLRTDLPPLARSFLLGSLTAEAASADPRAYAMAVARSTGWPDWLRLLLIRPLAYASTKGVLFPRETLEESARNPDPAIRLWAAFALSQLDPPEPGPVLTLDQACRGRDADRELGCLLSKASRLRGHPDAQKPLLDEATAWIQTHHAGLVRLREGWVIEDNRLVPRRAPKLQ